MPKETFYFSHDYNARNDDKILQLRSKYGVGSYGVFWMIIETMAENEQGKLDKKLIGGLSLGYGVAMGWLSEIIEYCLEIGLLFEEQGFIYSKRLLSHKDFRKELSGFGKDGARVRWGGYKGGHNHPNAKERKGKENKEKRGIYFLPDKLEVFFDDDTSQKLGEVQVEKFKSGNLMPNQIKKGEIK